jgi:hypothetical protein
MSELGFGAGGGINDEDAGLDGGSIDALGGCAVDVLGAGLILAICGFGGDLTVSFTFLLSLWSSLRENEGTASFGWVALDLGVDSSCSTCSGSDSWKEGASSLCMVVNSSSSDFSCFLAGDMPCSLVLSHGGKAFLVASG